ncbi:DUF4230 domain-containing protein [Clostridium psychrophilum]|uniref:DUF4230 domain-containing protein n=1 Tax=Clostridium psychrophilum TaxID=132926 RepID=UPI001C0E5EEB|nr:DUF4230 domain-containing protein [Clostridium psychrophilum]MBU3180455.1 DUF4230 domain-containing protein [Clostridium psychrophilum]
MHYQSKCKPIKHIRKLIFLIVILSVFIWIIMIYFMLNNIKNNKAINSTVISERLSKISELSTVKYNYSNILALKNSVKFKDYSIPFTEKSFLLKYSGYIKAGVDLKNVNIIINKKRITITLKKAKILDNSINNDDLSVYNEKSSMFNKLSMQDMVDEINVDKSKVEVNLLKTNFLDGANTNAKSLLEGILLNMGFEKVTIILK